MASPRLQQPFRALRHADFRIYWIGQWVSVIGTWMHTTALSWLLYRLTNSPAALGVLTLARFGPALVGSPLAGVLVDRFPRRRLVLLTQTASLVQATVLAVLTLSGTVQVWQLLALALLQGLVDTLDMPARQTLQVDLVGVADLQSAVSLNSSAFNVSRMVGPVVAGALTAAYGEGVCFAVNAASYLAVLVALLLVRVQAPAAPRRRSVVHELVEGLRFVWHDGRVRCVLIAMAVTSGIGLSYTTVLPVLARDVLGAGAQGYGVLLAGAGLGAVVGALAAATRPASVPAVRINLAGLAGVGLGLVALGLVRSVAGATALMAVLGLAVAVQMSTTNGFLQVSAPPALRGRVVGIYIWLFAGLAPLGGLLAGLLASRFGVTATAIASGLACCAAAALLGYTCAGEKSA
ncbi:MAG TPA: MFS transporter [Thermoanaerobaculaceae bacterium]|nr:MFS transporter [Thermoanaerobaculaceae bacterium]HRS16537.1 MFS transporter [Thermoanaerobaculaceae bacterium]